MGGLLLTVRLLLAVVFAVSGGAKVASLEGSRRSAAALGLPARAAAVAGTALPFVEIGIALFLLVAETARAAAATAAALLAAFTVLVVRSLGRGERPPCRCFGQLDDRPISAATVVRNVVLLAGAALVVAAGPGRDLIELLGG